MVKRSALTDLLGVNFIECLAWSVWEIFHPQLTVGFENSKLNPGGMRGRVSEDRATETGHSWIGATVGLHGPVSTPIHRSELRKHVGLVAIDSPAN